MTAFYYSLWVVSFCVLVARDLLKYRRFTPVVFIGILQLASILSLYLARPSFRIDLNEFSCAMFQLIASFILALSLAKYSRVTQFNFLSKRVERNLCNLVTVMSLVSLILNSFLAYKSLSHFTAIEIGVSQFKNDKIAADFLESIVPSYFYTIVAITTPFAFFALLLHFYFLAKLRLKMSFLMLVFSLAIPIGALHELSRGRLILFIEIYMFLYFLLSGVLHTSIRRKFRRIAFLVGAPILYILGFISSDRFDDFSNNSVGIIKNPVVLSLFDYAGQWHENSLVVLSEFHSELIMNGSRFGYFTRWIKDKLGYEIVDQFDRDIEVFGMMGTQFRGLISNLVYDMGFTLTLLFVILIWFSSGAHLKQKGTYLDMKGLMFYLGLVLFQSSFYQGNIVVLAFVSFTYLYIFYFQKLGLKFRIK